MVKQVIAFKDNYTDFSIHNYTNKYINSQRVLRIFVLCNYNFSSMIKFVSTGVLMNKVINKFRQKKPILMSPLALALAACGGGGGEAPKGSAPPAAENLPSLGKGSLTDTTSALFDRTLDVYGIQLLVGGAVGSQAQVPDEWAYKVAESFVMLMDPSASGIDVTAQDNMKEVLAGEEGTWHAGFGTAQRILKGAGSEYPLNPLQDLNNGQLNAQYGEGTEALLNNIMQDMIWYQNSSHGAVSLTGDGDIQELFEHALHTIHPWGVRGAVEGSAEALNYTKAGSREPHDANDSSWKTSELYLAFKEAIDNGVFDPSGYVTDPLNDPEQFMLATIEYTYILNFSMWEMGKEFWPDKNFDGDGILEGEWSETASTAVGVLAENPLGYALFNTYFAPVLSKPDFTTLRSMFQDNDGGLSGYQPDAVSAQAFLWSSPDESNQVNSDVAEYLTQEMLITSSFSDTLVPVDIS